MYLHCVLRRLVTSSTNWQQGFLCWHIASMEQAADTAEAAAVDHYFLSPTENISVPVCLQTLGRLMIVLRCALGLSVGGATQIAQLQLQIVDNSGYGYTE